MIGLPYGEKKLSQYVKPFSSDTATSRTDGRTDRQTDRFSISISRVSMLTRAINEFVVRRLQCNTDQRRITLCERTDKTVQVFHFNGKQAKHNALYRMFQKK